ncbi:protein FAM83F [Acipenser ruthenus]|uniref:protein FAM83F n=1 Tax=Acipenser ruthenus TaxID=7906 RepID=UPI002741D86D|nr:protein FAM83F [Acipenser ruthenus]
MADSQLQCVEDEHVNEKISESNPEFYYSEEQRSAVDQLLQNGDGAFRLAAKTGKIREFLSAKERKKLRKSWKRRDAQDEETRVERGTAAGTDTEVQSTYWPQLSDTEVPPLDIGWPDAGGYKGVTRVTIHTHPTKDNGPHIREVARRMIQEAKKVVAVVMDQFSDLLLFQDLLEAAYKRKVSVYLVLDSGGLPLFIEMCRRLEITEPQIRNMRVRSVAGTGLSLAMGKLPGTLSSKYMLVDGEKVLSGSYSFTWTASRLDRNLISVMTGHIVDVFDRDFRELYAVSDAVSLHRELGLPLPPNPTKPPPTIQTKPTVTSRFETNDGAPASNLRPPAHKYHNPKYSLVFGDALGLSSSKQDLTSASPGIMRRFLLSDAASSVVAANGDKQEAPAAPLPVTQNAEGTGGSGPKANGGLSKKLRSTFRGKNAKPNSPASPQLQPPLGPDRLNRSDQSFEFVEKESLEDGLGKLMRNEKRKSKLSKLSFSLPTVQTLEGDGSSSPTLSNGKDSRRTSKKGCITS